MSKASQVDHRLGIDILKLKQMLIEKLVPIYCLICVRFDISIL